MTRVAFLFPGQGSQRVGMGKELSDKYPELWLEYFTRADEILGFALTHLCFEGPEEELLKTENQQPAIFLVSVATLALLEKKGLKPDASAGHSLGEYSALVAAGSLRFEDGLRLARRRGELMAEVASRTGGAMAAVIGLSPERVQAICSEASSKGLVEVANFNSPKQTVISGEERGVQAAIEFAKEAGAQRVISLNVSAPFHCSLMEELMSSFGAELNQVEFEDPKIPIVANVTGDYETTAEEIRHGLLAQLASPVRWTDSMKRLIEGGFRRFVEVGPGRVLTGLMKSISDEVKTWPTNEPSRVDEVLRDVRLPH